MHSWNFYNTFQFQLITSLYNIKTKQFDFTYTTNIIRSLRHLIHVIGVYTMRRRHVWYTARCAYAPWRRRRQNARYWWENTSFLKIQIFSIGWRKIKTKISITTLNLSEKLYRFRISYLDIWRRDFLYYFKTVKLFVYKLRFIYLSMNKIIL